MTPRVKHSTFVAAGLAATLGLGAFALGQAGGGREAAPAPQAAGHYVIDPAHTSVAFRIRHVGLSDIYGRFNKVSGEFTLDRDDPAKSSMSVTIPVESIDTNQPKRDEHLRSDDFFDAKQFPTLTFKSTSVKPTAQGLDITGDLTMHGQTKPVTLSLQGGKEAEFPPKTPRTGFFGEARLNRQDWGVGKSTPEAMLGNEVTLLLGVEGTRK